MKIHICSPDNKLFAIAIIYNLLDVLLHLLVDTLCVCMAVPLYDIIFIGNVLHVEN